jgi:O-succinylbenzoate synthase
LLSAILTALAAEQGQPLSEVLQTLSGAASLQKSVEVGVSLGIQPTIRATLEKIEQHLAEGYRRIKLKIKPGWDVRMLRGVRAVFPDIHLMADANSAYTLDDLDLLKQMDEFHLLMIEQPLAYNDIYQHSLLQKALSTPLCLDESIETLSDAQLAWQLGACKIINLKPQRVGGLFEAIKIHNFCQEKGLPLWVGGMLETGVGRSVSMALAALPAITLPSDLSATARYYDPDLADPPFVLKPGTALIDVPAAPGLGVQVDRERVAAAHRAFTQAAG